VKTPLIKKVDCIQVYVPDIQSGIKFYQDNLGHKLKWRTNDSAGFQMQESESEIVIQTSRKTQETDLLVESVDSALATLVDAGARVLVPAFDIQVGRCAIVLDPWGNRLVILDLSKGILLTDSEDKVIGNKKR
jgi:lactoylglutathione lyase